jgi:thiol:disulfide interchange protein DsbD
MRFPRPLFLLLAILPAVLAGAGLARSAQPLPAEKAFTVKAQREGEDIRLIFTPSPGYYLYRDKFAAEAAGQSLSLRTPDGTVKQDPNFGESEIYHSRVDVDLPIPDARTIRLTYQGCQEDGICYPPLRRTLDVATLDLGPVDAGFGPPAATQSTPSGWQSAASDDTGRPDKTAPGAGEEVDAGSVGTPGMIERIAASGGAAMVVLSFLGFGLLLAFTPCVLPMYPILGGMLAREGERLNAARGFQTSLVYVTAMAAAFGLLGIVAAWSGQNLQLVLQSPIAIGALAAVFVVLALSMFGLFELQLPAALTSRIASAGTKRGSMVSAASLGFTSALIVGPCVTPPLAAALLYVGQSGNMALGAAALFALGFGQGLPLIGFATFGSGLLPRSGGWMESVKFAFGFIFLAAAVYMLSRVVPAQATMALWAALVLAIGVFVGGLDAVAPGIAMTRRAAKAAGVLALIYGGLLAIGAASGADDPLRPLARIARGAGAPSQGEELAFSSVTDHAALARDISASQAEGRPSLVYFTADWCVSCKVIERSVLPSPVTAQALDGFTLTKVDLSDLTDGKTALMKDLGVIGPPTMVFYDAEGRERQQARLVGEMSVDDLADAARRVKP